MALAPFPLAPPTCHPFFHLCSRGGTSHTSRGPLSNNPSVFSSVCPSPTSSWDTLRSQSRERAARHVLGETKLGTYVIFIFKSSIQKCHQHRQNAGRARQQGNVHGGIPGSTGNFMSFFEPNWSKVSHAPREWEFCSFFYASEVKEGRKEEGMRWESQVGTAYRRVKITALLRGASLLQRCVTLEAPGQCTGLLQAKITLCYRSSRPGARDPL